MNYLEENRGWITSSKIKDYLKSPEIYKLKYIDEMNLEWEKKCFKIWTALDDYFSYGEKEFNKKYFFDEMLTKDELQQILDERNVEYKKTDLKADLMDLVYWDWQSKIRLTLSEYNTIKAMIKELERQPLFKADSKYTPQREIKVEHKNLKLKWTLDRVFYEDNVFRDYKTTWDIKKLLRELQFEINKFYDETDNEYWFTTIWGSYLFSMSFYYFLLFIETWKEFDAILDIVSTWEWHASGMVNLDKDLMKLVIERIILPAINDLSETYKKYLKDKDESVWKITRDIKSLYNSPYFSYMESTKQKDFINLI